jgi:hypoxanthine phosphoribosyltransferase
MTAVFQINLYSMISFFICFILRTMPENMSTPRTSVSGSFERYAEFAYVGRGLNRKEPLRISADENSYGYHSPDKFLIPPHYRDDVKSVMIPRGLATDRIEKLAMDISQFYGHQELHLICILKGSRGFFSHLVECLNRLYQYTDGHSRPPYMEHYVRIKSYLDEATNTQKINIMSSDLSALKGKDVLLVEDIIDSGKTLKTFCKSLLDYHVGSLRIASMIEKQRETATVKADFVGFACPANKFIAGYCIDYNEMFRDLEHIVVLNDEAIEKYKK